MKRDSKRLENKAAAMSDVVEGSRQALDQIAKTDKNGKSFLRIDASHEPTRLELRDAIEKSTPERGTVMLNNKTPYTQSVSVNGVTYEVVANSKRAIDVPYRGFDVTTSSNRTLHWDFQFPKNTRVVDIDYVASPPCPPSCQRAITRCNKCNKRLRCNEPPSQAGLNSGEFSY